jgi:hypothetical protein
LAACALLMPAFGVRGRMEHVVPWGALCRACPPPTWVPAVWGWCRVSGEGGLGLWQGWGRRGAAGLGLGLAEGASRF